jgi:cytochrome c2
MRRVAYPAATLLIGALATLWAAAPVRADGDVDDFRASCANCHTIGGGPLVGPDLKDVTARIGTPDGPASRAWLVDFIVRPREILASGDPYAARLKAASRNQEMQVISGMTAKRAEALLQVIEAESKKERSIFGKAAGADLPTDPRLLAALVAKGRELFVGERALSAGGAACLGCHQAGDAGALGGGRLGPDLTAAPSRLGGVRALQAWLAAPPTPTMKPQFGLQPGGRPLASDDEILPLAAFLSDAEARGAGPDRTGQQLAFVILGVAGAGAALVGLDFAWRRRFRGVRASLTKGKS